MKILGTAGSNFIVEMTPSDVAAIVGYTHFDYSKEAREKLIELGLTKPSGYDGHAIVVGATVDLSGRFRRLLELESKHRELRGVGEKLRAMAGLMDHLGDAVIVPPKAD